MQICGIKPCKGKSSRETRRMAMEQLQRDVREGETASMSDDRLGIGQFSTRKGAEKKYINL
jgi:hypothetical protein